MDLGPGWVSISPQQTNRVKFPHSPILHYACGSMCVVLCFTTNKQKQRIVSELLYCFCHYFPLTMTCMQVKAFYHDKSGCSDKDVFQKLNDRKSKWTPPDGQFATVDFFLQKCRHDVSKLKFNRNSRSSNLKPDEWSALLNLRKRKDITIKAADKGGALVVWRTDLYQQEAFRHLSDNSFYCKVEKDLTPSNQKIVKETVHDLISKQELPATPQNLIITTPRTSVIYFKPKIHKPNNPGRPIVSAYRTDFAVFSPNYVTFC